MDAGHPDCGSVEKKLPRMSSHPAAKLYKGTLQTLGLSKLKGRRWAHVTPRYVMNRMNLHFYQRWHPDHPWLTRHMVAILGDWLQSGDRGHEWGSGRSTVWCARNKIGELTSVEHDPAWGETVCQLLRAEHVADKVDYHVFEQTNPDAERRYVESVQCHHDASLDFCLVDGLLRDRCALAALRKIKPGGILVIDNINWFLPRQRPSHSPNSRRSAEGCASPAWQEASAIIAPWRCIWTSDGVTDTALWVKPAT